MKEIIAILDFPPFGCRILDLGSIVLVVVYILFSSFNYLYASFEMYCAGLLQVSSEFKPIVAAQNFVSSLERALCFSSFTRARVPSLEPGFLRSSVHLRLRLVLDLRVAFLGSSERGLCFGFLRSSMLLGFRPEASICWIKRGFLHSSEVSLCLVARASLEYISWQQRGYTSFLHHLFYPNPRSGCSLSLYIPSL
ncbi:unnamed protein product [Camellia sinensis]